MKINRNIFTHKKTNELRHSHLVTCFAVTTTILLSLTVTSCSKDKSGAVDKNAKQVHIRVWEANDGSDKFIKQAGKEFTKLYPNIIIDYIYMDYDSASTAIARDGPLGIGPDIFAAPHDQLGAFVEGKYILPTENPESVTAAVLGSCSKALTYNGTMYGYPVSAETYALFYNKKLIKESEVPTTWEGLVEWGKKFSAEYPDKAPFVMDIGNAYYSIIFATSNNNRLFGTSGADIKNPNLNTDAAVKGYTFFQSLRSSLNLTNRNLDGSTCDALFATGNAALHITGPWNIKKFEEAGIDFGVASLPALPGETTPCASFSGTRGLFVNAYSRHPHEAALFAQFLLSPEMQKIRFEYTGAMPSVNVSVSSKYMSGFIKQLDYAAPMPSVPEMSIFWGEAGGAFWNIWNGANVKSELDALNVKFK